MPAKPFVLSLSVILSCLAAECVAQQQTATGSARLVAIRNTLVASEAPGIVRHIAVKAGAKVDEKGLLVRLNDETFIAEYDIAVAEEEIAKLEARNNVNVEYAQKSAEVAAAILEKSVSANKLYANAIPAIEIEKLRLEWEQARLSGEQAAMEWDAAQWNEKLKQRKQQAAKVRLDSRQVHAPFAGKIAQIFVQPGQWVNAGEPIVRLMNSERLRAEAYLDEALIRNVSVGQTAYFEYTLAKETEKVPATITFVGEEIVEGIFQVWAEFDNPDRRHLPGIEGRLIVE